MVKLVRFGEEHLETTRRWLTNSAGLREQIDCLSAPTRSENEAYWRAKWRDRAREDYAILDEAANYAGNCGLSEIDRQRKKAQLWIYLGDLQGQGIGRKAVRALLSRAFSELALERVYIRVLAINPRAYAFYKTLGFVEEGRLRHDTVQNSEYVDSFLLSMLSSEFQNLESRSPGNSL
ncbi:MAG TPA: GNAT family protein [Methylocella sp.]|nr:GNAT family protein [Methylocella sp.]